MAIVTDNIITWTDLATTCYNAMIAICCNIDNINNVPTRLKPGSAYLAVSSISGIGIANSQSKWTATWYGNGENLIESVSASTVSSEWNTFLSAAGIDSRSSKLIQAKETGLAIGLYQQFLAFHLKPIYSARQVYNTTEAQSLFQSMRYVTGECTPKYILTAIDPSTDLEVTDADIRNVVNQAIYNPGVDWGMLDSIGNPVIIKSYLS